MTEAEKLKEIKKLLAFIYFEWRKEITPDLVAYWRLNLKGIDRKAAWAAARKLVESKTFGEPKFQDFAECLKEITVKKRKYNPWGSPEPTREIVRTLTINSRKLIEQ